MTSSILSALRTQLTQNADEKTKSIAQRFFKEKVTFYGVKTATVEKIAKASFAQLKHKNKQEVFTLCEQLLQSGYCEEAWIAANWAYWLHDQYIEEDLHVFERWLTAYIDDWAKCDTLCNHAVGELVEMYPQTLKTLKTWTESPNRWVKRAAAVSLIIPAKKGKFLQDIFAIANNLLTDPDDMVQKGYGWMLKEASRLHQQEVFEYVLQHKTIMPRTALRYAIEKMPDNLRKKAMEK